MNSAIKKLEMKNLLAVILIFLFQIIIGQNNSATVIYKIGLNIDSLENVSNKFVNQMIEKSDSVYATLNFNSRESNYNLDFDLSIESGSPNLTRIFAGGDGFFYFDQENNEFMHETYVLDYPLIISKKPVDWIILKEKTKLINGYICIKAIYESTEGDDASLKMKPELVAWFCPEIPFSFGPERFLGLPGLVLECYSNIVSFKIDTITWHKEEIEIIKPDRGEIISMEEFKERAGKF